MISQLATAAVPATLQQPHLCSHVASNPAQPRDISFNMIAPLHDLNGSNADLIHDESTGSDNTHTERQRANSCNI